MTIQMDSLGKKKMSKEEETNISDEECRVHIFARQMLVTRIFTATYIGRYYIESLNGYRDAIKICDHEVELIRDFTMVKRRIEEFYHRLVWVSFTEPSDSPGKQSSGHCVWTKLENVPFGCYWFTLENVTFCEGGVMFVKAKVIREFKPEVSSEISAEKSIQFDEIKHNLISMFQQTFTWYNLKESCKFVFLLCMTIVTGLLYCLQYLGDYSLKFFREFNNFIRVTTPVFKFFFEFLTKVVGGFYMLIAMFWRGRPVQLPQPQQKFLRIQEQRPGNMRAIKPPSYTGFHFSD